MSTAHQFSIFRSRNDRGDIVWFHRNLRLSNQHCLYCGEFVGEGGVPSDKEHLIGRRMTPKGLMSDPASFNLIFRACRRCNAEKADLEDQIGAASLLTSPGREDPSVDSDARRRATASIDRRHGIPVGAVRNEATFKLGGFATFTTVAPAQIARTAMITLAFRHIQGLFSLVTSPDPTKTDTTRLLPGDQFGFYDAWNYPDWGNPQLIEIARRAQPLKRLAEITTADGFFRAALRRGISGEPWFWALEWNQNFRICGWIGKPEQPPELYGNLPDPGWVRIDEKNRMRFDVPLADDAEDVLFDPVTVPSSRWPLTSN